MRRSESQVLPSVVKAERVLYPRLGEAAWRPPRYYNNSGLLNASMQRKKTSHGRTSGLLLGNRQSIYDELRPAPAASRFYSNIATESEAELPHTSTSFINYQSTDYDPITNVVMRPVGPRTTKAIKGIGFARHKHLLSLGTNQQFLETFEHNPKVFFRRSGEFSKYKELLVKSQGGK